MHTPTSVLILLGAPGSGKGTQSKKLAAHYQLAHISTGDLLRAEITGKTKIGQQASAYIQAGLLVPDDLVMEILFNRLKEPDCQKGYILDGFPRTVAQAEYLREKLNTGQKVLVINLDVSDEEIIKRISGRILCKNCGAIYHTDFSPPKSENVCDVCSGDLYRRTDDHEKIVRERLAVYSAQTAPLIAFYTNKGMLKHLDGTRSSHAILADLKTHLDDLLAHV